MPKIYKTFAADTEEELTNIIKRSVGSANVIPSTDYTGILQMIIDINKKLATHDLSIDNIEEEAEKNKDSITQFLLDINDLTSDKVEKLTGDQFHSYSFALDESKDGYTINNGNVITGSGKGKTVKLFNLSNDAEGRFIRYENKTYTLPISNYDPSYNPIRTTQVIPVKDIEDGLVFSATGPNAPLEITINANPADITAVDIGRNS